MDAILIKEVLEAFFRECYSIAGWLGTTGAAGIFVVRDKFPEGWV